MNRVAGRCPAHTSRRIVSGLVPGAGNLAADISKLGAGIECVVDASAAHVLGNGAARHVVSDLAADLLGRTLARRHRAAAAPIAVQEIERVVRALRGAFWSPIRPATTRARQVGARTLGQSYRPTSEASELPVKHIPLEFNR